MTQQQSTFLVESQLNLARTGQWITRSGVIQTPAFMPPATRGAIRGAVSFEELEETKTQICLGNTYHLWLNPGDQIVKKLGGLHNFTGWQKPWLTDSGGFQVFSLPQTKIIDEGVWFRSHINGQKLLLTPEKSMKIQQNLNSDVMMVLDQCPPSNLSHKKVPSDTIQMTSKEKGKLYQQIKAAVERTTEWARRSLNEHKKTYPLEISAPERPQIFGIVQGGIFSDLRQQSYEQITSMPFDGFALGGLAVGESAAQMYQVLSTVAHKLPANKPRYLMGVGTPIDLLMAVEEGVDIFDCVMPMRNARHGNLFTSQGKLNLRQTAWQDSNARIDDECSCKICLHLKLSRGYLHHLLRVKEDLAKRYLTIHNLHYYQNLLQDARHKIMKGTFTEWKKTIINNYEEN